jgi:hypothetical protein
LEISAEIRLTIVYPPEIKAGGHPHMSALGFAAKHGEKPSSYGELHGRTIGASSGSRMVPSIEAPGEPSIEALQIAERLGGETGEIWVEMTWR